MKKMIKMIVSAFLVVALLPLGVSYASDDGLYIEKFVYTPRSDGFLKEPETTLPVIGKGGFIKSLEEELPTLPEDGFLAKDDNIVTEPRADGFFLEPETFVQTPTESGFVTEVTVPSILENGFIYETNTDFSSFSEGEFLAKISKPSSTAKKISTAEELAQMTSGNYELANDIDLSTYNGGEWIPLMATKRIKLDGQGHKIYHLNVNNNTAKFFYDDDMVYAGLFASTTSTVEIKNLAIVNTEEDAGISVSSDWESPYIGGFVGKGKAVISNCFITGIKLSAVAGWSEHAYAGGFVGEGDSDITDSYFSGTVYARGVNDSYAQTKELEDCSLAGGLVGHGSVYIENSRVKVTSSGGSLLGAGGGDFLTSFAEGEGACGFVEHITENTTFEDCRNDCPSIGGGGFAGNVESGEVEIVNCSNFADGMAGIVGKGELGSKLILTACYNEGNMTMGGLVGECDTAEFLECINIGNVTGIRAGGICGKSIGTVTAELVYNAGEICGRRIGGILGEGTLYAKNSKNSGKIYGSTYDGSYISGNELRYYGGLLGTGILTAENCINEGNLERAGVEDDLSYVHIGGMAGYAKVALTDCVNYGNITDTAECTNSYMWSDYYAGGIVGLADTNSYIVRCINYGDIVVDLGIAPYDAERFQTRIGGMVGCCSGAFAMKGCLNEGDISCDKGEFYAGGILGYVEETVSASITDCANNGSVSGGGILEEGSSVNIYNCYNTGNTSKCGIAVLAGNISYCYNTADATQSGIVFKAGDISYCTNRGTITEGDGIGDGRSITGCCNSGKITGGNGIGDAVTISNCYNLADVESGSGIGNADFITSCYNKGVIYKGNGICKEGGDIYECFNSAEVKEGNGIAETATNVDRCYNTGKITGGNGLVNTADKISNCYNAGVVAGTHSAAIAQKVRIIDNCFNTTPVEGVLADRTGVSGLVGEAVRITHCYNTGDVSLLSPDGYSDTVKSLKIAGLSLGDGEILNSFNSGDIRFYSKSGKIVSFDVAGLAAGSVTAKACYNSGCVSVSAYPLDAGDTGEDTLSRTLGKLHIGGICSQNGILYDCVNSGAITMEANLTTSTVSELYTAGLCGGSGDLENCFNTANITTYARGGQEWYVPVHGDAEFWGENITAGLTGKDGTLIHCYNKGAINALEYTHEALYKLTIGRKAAAGLSGGECTIVNCFNEGQILSEFLQDESGFYLTAGACGLCVGYGEIVNSYNTADITARIVSYEDYSSAPAAPTSSAAGLCGTSKGMGNCYNTGEISGFYGGGLTLSLYEGNISHCLNEGNVNGIGDSSGICGSISEGSVSECINRGNVTGSTVGGIAETMWYSTINKCFNYGSVYGNDCVGGIVGYAGIDSYINDTVNYGAVRHTSSDTLSREEFYYNGDYRANSHGVGGVIGYVDFSRHSDTKFAFINNGTKNYGNVSHSCLYTDGCRHERIGNISGNHKHGIYAPVFPEGLEIIGSPVIAVGGTEWYQATFTPVETTERELSWSSSDPSVAMVNASGMVTGISEGECIITARTVNGIEVSKAVKVLDNSVIIKVMGVKKNEKPYVLEGADVVIEGVCKVTDMDGIAVFKKEELPDKGSAEVMVSCGEDYVTYQSVISLALSGSGMNTQTYCLQYKADEIYITDATITDNDKAYKLLELTNVKYIPMYNKDGSLNQQAYFFDVEMDWNKCKDNVDSHKIWLEGEKSKKTLSLNEGRNHVLFGSTFDLGEKIYIKASAIDKNGELIECEKLLPVEVVIIDFDMDIMDTETVSLDDVYFFEGLGTNLSLKNVGRYVADIGMENGVLKVSFGSDDEESKAPLGVFEGKSKVTVDLIGKLEIPLVNPYAKESEWSGSIALVSKGEAGGKLMGSTSGNGVSAPMPKLFGHTYNFNVAGIPLFFEFGFYAAAGGELGVFGPYDEMYFRGKAWGNGKFSVYGGVGGGFDVDFDGEDDLEAKFGPEGNISAMLPVTWEAKSKDEKTVTFDPSLEGNVNGKLTLKGGEIVDFDSNVRIGYFTWNKDGVDWEWWGNSSEDEKSPMLLSVADNGWQPVGRGYLANDSGFINGGVSLFSTAAASDCVYQNIFQEAESQITDIDGKEALYFTSDNTNRDERNGLTLYQTIKTNGLWSDPVAIEDDGTADTNPSADGKFVIWEDASRVLTDGDGLEAVLETSDISVAVKTSTGYVTTRLTEDDRYDYSPKIAAYGDKAMAVWLSNSENNLLGREGVTSLHYSCYDGTWSEPVTVENIGAVTNLYLTYDENGGRIFYKNAKGETFIYADSALTAGETVKGRYVWGKRDNNDVLAYFDAELNLHVLENGAEVKVVPTAFAKRENPLFVSNGKEAYILWIEESGIYYISCLDGNWSDRTCFADGDAYIKELSAFANADGFTVSYLKQEEEGWNLISSSASKTTDLVLCSLTTDGKWNEEGISYTATIWNNSMYAATPTLSFYEDEEFFAQGNPGAFAPGEIREVTGILTLEPGYVKREITAKLFTANTEPRTDNNDVTFTVGKGDVAIDNAYFTKNIAGQQQLVAEIRNAGSLDLEKVTVSVRKGDRESEPVYTTELYGVKSGWSMPISFAETQSNTVYYVSVETESDEDTANNEEMIAYDLVEEPTNISVVNKLLTGEITLPETSSGVKVMAAVYDGNGVLLEIKNLGTVENETTYPIYQELETAIPGTTVKVFCWRELLPVIRQHTYIVKE